MTFREVSLLAGTVLLVSLGGCRASSPPVATLEVEPATIDLGYPSVVDLRMRWQIKSTLQGLSGEPYVFVHILDEPGSVVRTFDHPVKFDWGPGTEHEYEVKLFQSGLAPPLAPGQYQLSVGLYDQAGHRWPLSIDGEEIDRMEYLLSEVSVPVEGPEVPLFYFSPSWQPLEGGTDRQILARRWLAGDGSIRVAEIPEVAGSLWMLLRIPLVESEGEELVLEPGAQQPVVLLRNSCDETEVRVSGFGTHEVALALAQAEAAEVAEAAQEEDGTEEADEADRADGADEAPTADQAADGCTVTFEPNYHVLRLDTLMRRSVALDALAWAPAEGA